MFDLLKIGLCNKYYMGSTLHIIISFVAVVIIGYLLGSLNFGVIISKAIYKDDIRKHGSGGSGATNMLRTYGKIPAALTFLGDGLKAVAAVLIGALFLGGQTTFYYDNDGMIYSAKQLFEIYGGTLESVMAEVQNYNIAAFPVYSGIYIGGLASIIGHAFPVYYGFKGGKSVAATFFMVLCTSPVTGLICLIFFIAIVWGTKYVSLGSVMAVLIYPLILSRMTGYGLHNIIAIFISLFIVYLHRGNIIRLINGKENKISFKNKEKKKKEQGGADG